MYVGIEAVSRNSWQAGTLDPQRLKSCKARPNSWKLGKLGPKKVGSWKVKPSKLAREV